MSILIEEKDVIPVELEKSLIGLVLREDKSNYVTEVSQ